MIQLDLRDEVHIVFVVRKRHDIALHMSEDCLKVA